MRQRQTKSTPQYVDHVPTYYNVGVCVCGQYISITKCFCICHPSRRHVLYLWHHWRREHQHHCSSNGGSESVHLHDSNPGLPTVSAQSCAESVNGQRHASEVMEVEGVSLPDPRDSKRLKRGVLLPGSPTLPSEHSFVSGILDSCFNPEQRHFALAYKKWLDTVIGQQPWERERERGRGNRQPHPFSTLKLPLDTDLRSVCLPVVLTLTNRTWDAVKPLKPVMEQLVTVLSSWQWEERMGS